MTGGRHTARVLPHRSSSRRPAATAPPKPDQSAASAGLRYVTDHTPGITRRRAGRGFLYISPPGTIVRDKKEIGRIRALVIPPAWKDVWICANPLGHLQATGRDARGRKQHRYHPRWRRVRDEAKYDRLVDFAGALPNLRRQTVLDIAS